MNPHIERHRIIPSLSSATYLRTLDIASENNLLSFQELPP